MPLLPMGPVTRRSDVIFYDGINDPVNIPNPELGDNDAQLSYTSLNTNAQGGISIFKHASQKARIRELTFKDITENIVLAFQSFLKTNLGKTITWTDMDNNEHDVIILDTVQFEEVTDSTCRYFNFTVRMIERV